MNKLLLTFSCFSMWCLGTSAYAQNSCNLIVNGNFEKQNVATGKQLDGRINNVLNTSTNIDELANWQATTFGTPDYFARNAPYGSDTNPATTTYFGAFTPFQPASGADNGGTLGLVSSPSDSPVGGEYVTQTLSTSLRGDRSYYASMQVQLASGANTAGYMGMYITVSDPKSYSTLRYYSPSAPPAGCGIQSPAPVTSKSWTRVSNVFPGAAGAKYVNIGDFTTGASPSGSNGLSYTHIDEVELYQIPTAGTNIASCSGLAVTLGEGCHIPGAVYSWSAPGLGTFATSSNNPQVTVYPTTTTTYTLAVALPDGTHFFSSSATVRVSTAPTIDGGSFYITRYQGCDKVYGITIQAVPNATRYFAQASLAGGGGNNVEGTYNASNNRVTFQLEILGNGNQATGTVTAVIPGGPCNAQPLTITQVLQGPDAGCNNGPGTMDIVSTPYPNPANEAIILPTGAESATLFNAQGKEVKNINNSGKVDVQNLPNGLYNLRILQGKKTINKQIQVKH